MAPSLVHLPNGQNLTVAPVFGGVSFKPNELTTHRSAFPPGWTIVINEEDGPPGDSDSSDWEIDPARQKKYPVHRYKKPTLQNDHVFISTISSPSNADFKPATSPTRQIAMMLWATLWWYFHQPEPDPRLTTPASAKTADEGKPRGEWRININRQGIFKAKNLLLKLERMGLITTDESAVSVNVDDVSTTGHKLFVTRRAFWQMDARVFLFTLAPATGSPVPGTSPFSSRPNSPSRIDGDTRPGGSESPRRDANRQSIGWNSGGINAPISGPFATASHLPTYFPPHPPRWIFTNGIRHPARPKPYRQGETIYLRYIPSFGQYLSFRVASLSSSAPSQHGPWSVPHALSSLPNIRNNQQSMSDSIVPTMSGLGMGPSDLELLHTWMNDPRVAASWGEAGPMSHQEQFLKAGLKSRHSFPVIGCWDGKPFGYFEIYWVKEDKLGAYLGGNVEDWDRGLHVLIGENQYRGPARVKVWLSALVHYCWISDMRTNNVMLEPRVDNTKMLQYCINEGFHKEREIAFPHKQSNLMKICRETWEKPAT